MNTVFILCGGQGTRLANVISDIPKPMAPINGTPFLSVLLNYLVKQSVKEVVLLTGYKGDVIKNYYGDSYKSLNIKYSQELIPLGTGGSLVQALSLLEDKEFILVNGDTFFDIDLKNFDKDHNQDCELTIALTHISNDSRYNFIKINKNSEITSISKKQSEKNGLINGGIMKLQKKIFSDQKIENFSLEDFLFGKISFFKTSTFTTNNTKFIDIGIPEDYLHAQTLLAEEALEALV